MDKGRRTQLSKKKQKQRLKQIKEPDWMNESITGKLKNHGLNMHSDNKKYSKYKRPEIFLDEDE